MLQLYDGYANILLLACLFCIILIYASTHSINRRIFDRKNNHLEEETPEKIAERWVLQFADDIRDPVFSLKASFLKDCFWRDLLAFTNDYHTIESISSVEQFFARPVLSSRPSNFKLAPGIRLRHPSPSKTLIQGLIHFDTNIAHCTAIFTLVREYNNTSWKAWTLVTVMDRFKGMTDRFGPELLLKPDIRPPCVLELNEGTNWNYTALVLGAGQAGLSTAARLENLGVRTLVVEKSSRLGDNWRRRYDALKINTPKSFSHLPFVPFPKQWPQFFESCDVADHLEGYPGTLGLHILTSSTVKSASFNDQTLTWSVEISLSDGSTRTVSVRHLVLATGVDTLAGTIPVIPQIPHQNSFRGTIIHSSAYGSSVEWGNKRVAVVGAGCSGHDIAQDLYNNGARCVTLVQRSSTSVISRTGLYSFFPGLYFGENLPPTEIADRYWIALPMPASRTFQQQVEKNIGYIDRQLHEDLSKKGYLLPSDDEDTYMDRLLIRRGGYYIDQGCCNLVLSGKVHVKSGQRITSFSPDGLLFADGSMEEADLVVYATGFHRYTIKEVVKDVLGAKVSNSLPDSGGWDSESEFVGLWRPTGHRGLWLAGGDLFTSRFYSQLLALQIKADENHISWGRYDAH